MPVTWSCWKTSHLAEDTLLSWATNPDSYSSLADYAEPCRIRINILARLLHLLRCMSPVLARKSLAQCSPIRYSYRG